MLFKCVQLPVSFPRKASSGLYTDISRNIPEILTVSVINRQIGDWSGQKWEVYTVVYGYKLRKGETQWE